MIDLKNETALSLAAATRLLPPGRQGRPVSLSCILRWVLTGAKSLSGEMVRLEAVRLGGRWLTSVEALQRFAERLTPTFHASPPMYHTPARRRRASEKAAAELGKAGI
jgi:hypothetical protein